VVWGGNDGSGFGGGGWGFISLIGWGSRREQNPEPYEGFAEVHGLLRKVKINWISGTAVS
jgi:hypothetical protein